MVQMIEEDYVGPLYWKTVTLEIFHEGIAHCLSPEGINNGEEKPRVGGGGIGRFWLGHENSYLNPRKAL